MTTTSQSVQASVTGDDVYGRDRTSHVVAILIPPDGEKVDDPQWSAKMVNELNQVVADHQDQIVSWVGWLRAQNSTWSRSSSMKTSDMTKTFVSIPLKGDDDDRSSRTTRPLNPRVRQLNGGHIQLAGLNPLASALTGPSATTRSAPRWRPSRLVAVVLFFVFGTVISATLPAIIGGLTIMGALGIMRLVAVFTPVHFFAQPVCDADRPRHRHRLRAVHSEPVRERDRGGLRHRGRGPKNDHDVGPHGDVLGTDHRASLLPLLLFPQGS